MEKKQPQNPFHPGEMLVEEFLEPAGINQLQFAQKVGWPRTRVNEFIKGKRGVTADAALDLAKALGTSAKLWMNLQATYYFAPATNGKNQHEVGDVEHLACTHMAWKDLPPLTPPTDSPTFKILSTCIDKVALGI